MQFLMKSPSHQLHCAAFTCIVGGTICHFVCLFVCFYLTLVNVDKNLTETGTNVARILKLQGIQMKVTFETSLSNQLVVQTLCFRFVSG